MSIKKKHDDEEEVHVVTVAFGGAAYGIISANLVIECLIVIYGFPSHAVTCCLQSAIESIPIGKIFAFDYRPNTKVLS